MAASSFSGLQYAPFASSLEPTFWNTLSKNKLEVYGLDDKAIDITGFYFNNYAQGIPCRLNLDYTAFNKDKVIPARSLLAQGTLKNFNTIDDFKNFNKTSLLEDCGKQLWTDIVEGKAIRDPSLLVQFYLLTFADLKKYHYYYWFAFPALKEAQEISHTRPVQCLAERFTQQQISSLMQSYDAWRMHHSAGFFLLHERDDVITVHSLTEFDEIHRKDGKVLFGVCDPCTLEKHPGWPLRNFLTLVTLHWGALLENQVEVLCLRDRHSKGERNVTHSLVLSLRLHSLDAKSDCPPCVGWEKNEKQKLGPRMVNLSASMDPNRLAESAVDLNLQLMRWRLLPELNLEKIASTKCLLLGAGTLGCNVARCLLGWGVRTLTLVDNGKISYSNPVRQSLFTFEDSLHGGKPKAETAAEALKRIFPGVNAQGVSLSIPMPGHSISDSILEQTKLDVEKLDALIKSHDAVFLLLDTRESRWLPTVIGMLNHKIVLNAALGFDTYLVMRHGVRETQPVAMETEQSVPQSLTSCLPGSQLGCYFCNDVVAPGNSTRDRTLDQQCTVSRPGMSYMVGALVVELLVSILSHPQGAAATADTSAKDEHLTKEAECPLGLVPHQIRGFLSRFHTLLPASRSFDKCTACSPVVLEHYEKEGFSFLLNVFNTPSYLEDLTGLTKLHQETELTEVWELSDDESMEDV